MREKLRELDLNLLVILDALLRCQSVSHAAEELQMSQSAVSHSLKRLRILFDDDLFVRSREGMSPTPKALEISGLVIEIIRLARATLLPSQSFDPHTSKATLHLALGDAGDMSILPSLTQHLRENGHHIDIASIPCSPEEAIPLLGTGKLNLYVGAMHISSSDILCQKLFEDRLVVVTARSSPIGDTIGFDEYSATEHIMHQVRRKPGDRSAVADLFERQGMLRKVRIETPHIAAIPLILERNDHLLATMPLSLAEYYRKSAAIRIAEPDFYLPKIEVSQYWHRRYNNDPFVMWIRRTLRDLFQSRELSLG